ncbi:MAG: hypothetical protein MZU79_04910 [Anaerotruncus sp.]|nr:hypothetical protein [Anaerotruncus sp.]
MGRPGPRAEPTDGFEDRPSGHGRRRRPARRRTERARGGPQAEPRRAGQERRLRPRPIRS